MSEGESSVVEVGIDMQRQDCIAKRIKRNGRTADGFDVYSTAGPVALDSLVVDEWMRPCLYTQILSC